MNPTALDVETLKSEWCTEKVVWKMNKDQNGGFLEERFESFAKGHGRSEGSGLSRKDGKISRLKLILDKEMISRRGDEREWRYRIWFSLDFVPWEAEHVP